MLFRMIDVKDSLLMGKVWSLDFLGTNIMKPKILGYWNSDFALSSFLFQDLFPFRESISLPPLLAVFRSKIVGCLEIKWNLEVYNISNLPERSKLHDQISPKKFQNKKKDLIYRDWQTTESQRSERWCFVRACFIKLRKKYQEKPDLSKVAPNFAWSSRRNSPFSCLKNQRCFPFHL